MTAALTIRECSANRGEYMLRYGLLSVNGAKMGQKDCFLQMFQRKFLYQYVVQLLNPE